MHVTVGKNLFRNKNDSQYKRYISLHVSNITSKYRQFKAELASFYILIFQINGRQNYVIMERIAKALELFTSMEKRL